MNDLEHFRKEKDHFFASDPHSPLTDEQQKTFQGLQYFPENLELRLDLPVETFPDKQMLEIQTSTGEVRNFERFGKVRFQVEGQPVEMTIFKDENGFFLPFADALSGEVTYGAGRYLEPISSGEGKLYLDFNYAYNPYCAYNELYSCPLTPPENRLKVPIQAGEKLPKGDWIA